MKIKFKYHLKSVGTYEVRTKAAAHVPMNYIIFRYYIWRYAKIHILLL